MSLFGVTEPLLPYACIRVSKVSQVRAGFKVNEGTSDRKVIKVGSSHSENGTDPNVDDRLFQERSVSKVSSAPQVLK